MTIVSELDALPPEPDVTAFSVKKYHMPHSSMSRLMKFKSDS
jgi:hypothetical protein